MIPNYLSSVYLMLVVAGGGGGGGGEGGGAFENSDLKRKYIKTIEI